MSDVCLGAGDWNRTRNLLITNQLLCQLSYTSKNYFKTKNLAYLLYHIDQKNQTVSIEIKKLFAKIKRRKGKPYAWTEFYKKPLKALM